MAKAVVRAVHMRRNVGFYHLTLLGVCVSSSELTAGGNQGHILGIDPVDASRGKLTSVLWNTKTHSD